MISGGNRFRNSWVRRGDAAVNKSHVVVTCTRLLQPGRSRRRWRRFVASHCDHHSLGQMRILSVIRLRAQIISHIDRWGNQLGGLREVTVMARTSDTAGNCLGRE